MLHIGICDDEQSICNAIEKTLRVISSNLLVEIDIEVFASGAELYGYLENGANLDMLFLDIMMDVSMVFKSERRYAINCIMNR